MRASRFFLIVGLLLLAGCGGSSSSSTTSALTSVATGATTTSTAPKSTIPAQQDTAAGSVPATTLDQALAAAHPTYGSPSQVPLTKGGDNSIQTYGSEASGGDRAAAARSLLVFLHAFASGNGKLACALLDGSVLANLQRQLSQGSAAGSRGPHNCPEVIAFTSRSENPQVRRQSSQVTRVLSLRAKGATAFLIYDGSQNKPYNVPMRLEGGVWKLGTFAGIPLD